MRTLYFKVVKNHDSYQVPAINVLSQLLETKLWFRFKSY